MNFEHFDASGMSYRSTTKDGIAMYGEGGEGSPAELDPLGGNVGLSTPYIELEPEPMPPFEPGYPSLQAFGYEDQMVINGQRVSCTLDGMAVGCGQAIGMLVNGSALFDPRYEIPHYLLSSLGIVQIGVIPGSNDAPPPPGQPDNGGAYATRDTPIYAYFGSVSWSPPQQPRQLLLDEVLKLRNSVQELVKQENCFKFIEKLLDTAQEVAEQKNTFESLRTHMIMGIFDAVEAGGGFSIGNSSNTKKGDLLYNIVPGVKAPEVQLSFMYYFPSSLNDEYYKKYPYMKANREGTIQRLFNPYEGGMVTLHELIHFNFHDLTLASAVARMKGENDRFKAVTDKSVTLNDTADASKYWNDELKANCELRKK